MRLRIDGKDYEFDATWLMEQYQAKTGVYVDPNSPEGRKYTDIRLAAKGLLRFHLPKILQTFAQIFNVADWRTLKPRKDQDLLQVLHEYMSLLLHAETQLMVLELETVQDESLSESGTPTQLTLTGAAIGQHVLYQWRSIEPADGERAAFIPAEQPAEQPAGKPGQPRQLEAPRPGQHA